MADRNGRRAEPIAIIGMACRFPGAEDLAAFWRMLDAGGSGVIEGVPGSGVGRVGELFSESEGKRPACRFGAYLDGLDQFDAAFFRISPVEAQLLDPQQRLMLETCWRAVEDAGMAPDRLKGSRTGVYAGISNNEYRGLILDTLPPDEPAVSLYSVTGTSFNTAIGRVAFALGLEGPALALDTACSSSLVAIHAAATGLQRGEADLALAGGVHAILSGRLLEMRANAGMLSPDGRCATFDAAANGYVRGEGCGIVVLKRLAEAEADGDRIWAVVRGSALNQDGASPGLTVPSGPAQEKVIQAALQQAGLDPAQVDYVEAHGTGTEVGDPIEARATGSAYARGRDPGRPLLIGSVKTNIGHLEAAAGVAGVIKTVLAMRRGVIPRHLHFRDPSPQIPWERLPLQVTATPTDWPDRSGARRRAGVSGFGWSGTNAHLVLEGYGDREDFAAQVPGSWTDGSPRSIAVSLPASFNGATPVAETLAPRGKRFLPLAARTDQALRDLAGRYRSWMDDRAGGLAADEAASVRLLADMAWSAAIGRTHFEHRAGVVFHDADSLHESLRALQEADETSATRAAKRVAFVYTGQASQWPGMGAALYASEPVVRAVLDRCDALLAEERGASLLDVMFGRTGPVGAGDLDDPRWKQPAIYALECALAALWESVGVRPDVVLGHSLGEIAAAHTAGVFSLEEGLRFAAARGTLIGALPGDGAMAAVFAPPSRVAAALDEHNATSDGIGLCVAADNGAHQAISGPAVEIEAILERFEADGVRVARLRRSPAYHSAMVEPALDDLEAALAETAFAPPSLTFVSNLTGRALGAGQAPDAAYWRRQAREPVAFRAGVETLAEIGVDAVIEVGPHAVLGPMTTMAWPEASGTAPPVALSSLLRPAKGEEAPAAGAGGGFVEAVAGAWEAGLPVSFPGLFAGEARRRIALPDYPFQRESYWIEAPRRRRSDAGHPLLGVRHESASGEIAFDTEVFPSDPAWLGDHRVFGRLIAPGALYGAMAASAARAEGSEAVVIEDFQIRSALVFPDQDGEEGAGETARRVQVLLDFPEDGPSRRVRVLSRAEDEEGWTLHAEGRIAAGVAGGLQGASLDVEAAKTELSPVDLGGYYRAKASVGIDLGPAFRTVEALWSSAGEAIAEVTLDPDFERTPLDVHPLVLDGCFQAFGAARNPDGGAEGITYLPFAWERLWLTGRLPDRLVCHVRMREAPDRAAADARDDELREVQVADLRLYDPDGTPVGELAGFTVKRATRAALLSAVEGVDELLYEVIWRDRALEAGIAPADFLTSPSEVAATTDLFTGYLENEGVDAEDRAALLADLEQLSRAYALQTLDALGWRRVSGDSVDSAELRERLGVGSEHERLFRRMLEMQVRAGVLEQAGDGFVVTVASGEPLPEGLSDDPDTVAEEMAARYAHGTTEIGLFRRSAGALAEVLQGRMDPLTLLFSSGEPTAADLYMKAPVARAANRLLADATAALLSAMPAGRRLRVLEVGAGTGSGTAAVLPELPEGSYDYTYTDISAGFFAEAESRFGGAEASIDYRVLDIEKDPVAQGVDRHGYDLVIASNVLHATRYLNETLEHCLAALSPSGQLIALENLRGQGWLDLTFGQLDGWWRFADDYRPHHALATPAVWRQALADAGFEDIAILGFDEADPNANPDRGVIVAQGPAEVTREPGTWVLAADRGDVAAELANTLAAHNQTVVLAGAATGSGMPSATGAAGVVEASVEAEARESWAALLDGLPSDPPLAGVVHLGGLDGHGSTATTDELAEDARRTAAGALALTQALAESEVLPSKGLWFLTRGGQMVERERGGELVGATLWGFGKVAAREAPQLQPRMLDLDPADEVLTPDLVNELLHPDAETHIAYRFGRRQGARLVRAATVADRLSLPEEPGWELQPDPGGSLEALGVMSVPESPLAPGEIRAAIEAFGLNFRDVFIAIGLVDDFMGGEFCGRVLEVGEGVTSVAVGDRVVGMTFRNYGAETVTLEEMVVPAPPGFSVTELATIPTAFVSAALSFELSGLDAGDRVLIHAGAGGVGLAAIQLARAAGAEVFATASARKRDFVRSLGVKHVFDSRTTAFGAEILAATGGTGVDMVLNSLTGEGFIEASLSCLAEGGRFVEMGRVDILSEEEMAAVRPDVQYAILMIDVLKEEEPARAGELLRGVMERMVAGELAPLIHARWPVAETGAAMKCMQGARHVGKIVLANSPLARGTLREDRTYLVTGGLGGLGVVVAGWLADRGAGAIVLNGRRPPDPEVSEAIEALRGRGATVEVELADVTDDAALDAMLARMDADLPPLAGVIHSVGVLSDATIGNQSWETFERVLWPKMLGAWHLHRATAGRDLDMFVLFSSVAGILGNPGQANHAAANAFLDQLAGYRRSQGLPGQAIAWGAWSDIGEAEEQRERFDRQRSALGGRWFTPQQGLRALDRLVRQDATTSVVMAMDWDVFEEAVEEPPPLLEDLLSAAAEAGADDAEGAEDILTRVGGTPAAEWEALLASFVQAEVQAVLRLPSAPAPTVGFFDLGMDSLMAVELRNRLNRALSGAYSAPNTLVFDYPNITELAAHLAKELDDGGASPAGAPELASEVRDQASQRDEEGDDGVAIVGMACRFPGAPDLAAFWRQLESRTDAVTDGRRDAGPWTGVAGDPASDDDYSRHGAFLEDIDKFDARFFGIRPIEARMMDPRQRLLLETTWHALEDAGLDPVQLKGTSTGVYTGVTTGDYRDLAVASGEGPGYLGTTMSVTAGRISFALGLTGPAVPLDLACASSLVAVHQAAAALRQGEVGVALAGGVNAILWPGTAELMKEVGLLSASGRCHSFDAAADGFVRGEGCGMVVLKRLADARADGDRIWGVIRGSAVNQNGTSAALTVPNGPAQERVIEDALAQAGVSPAEVDYLEAHAAGSDLGDPIEVQAAATVYGRGRDEERPLLVGSVKTNIGHLECAAGIASLIKMVLAMNEGRIPPQLHFHDPNPHLAWDHLPVRITAEPTAWPSADDRPPRAGVSSFGISGTNAHVVVEGNGSADPASIVNGGRMPAGASVTVPAVLPETEGGPSPVNAVAPRDTRLLPLSAKSPAALRELAKLYLEWLEKHGGAPSGGDGAASSSLADMAWTAGVGRSHFPHRAGVPFRDRAGLRDELSVLAARPVEEGSHGNREAGTPPRVAFVYTGEGGASEGAGQGLYDREPVVRAILDRCDQALRKARDGASLLDVMFGRENARGTLRDPEWAQPAVYALGCALTALWVSVGVRPGAVAGEDVGELTAAWAAGVFSLEDGLRLAATRGVAMARPKQRLGAAMPVDEKDGAGRDPLDDLEAAAQDIDVSPPSVALISQVTGRRMDPRQAPNATYWREQVRASRSRRRLSAALADLGVDLVLEIGPAAVGPTALADWPGGTEGADGADDAFAFSVARAYETGLPVSFAGLFAGEARRRIPLPGYPFQRRRHWIETSA